MSCECIDYKIEFPSEIACLLHGYSFTLPTKVLGFGGKSYKPKPKVEAKFFLGNMENINLFSLWWIGEIDYGNSEFDVSIELYGAYDTYKVRVINTEEIAMAMDNWTTDVTLKLEIVDDVEQKLMSNTICSNVLEGCTNE